MQTRDQTDATSHFYSSKWLTVRTTDVRATSSVRTLRSRVCAREQNFFRILKVYTKKLICFYPCNALPSLRCEKLIACILIFFPFRHSVVCTFCELRQRQIFTMKNYCMLSFVVATLLHSFNITSWCLLHNSEFVGIFSETERCVIWGYASCDLETHIFWSQNLTLLLLYHTNTRPALVIDAYILYNLIGGSIISATKWWQQW